MQRKDYALAEETMRNFAQKYPGDPLIADSQYWLGESFFQRQQYRDAAEILPCGDHQIRQIGQGAGCAAAAWTVAGGPEGEGGRLRRVRRGDAEISARLHRRQGRPSIASRSGLSAEAWLDRLVAIHRSWALCAGSPLAHEWARISAGSAMPDDDQSPISASEAKRLFAEWKSAPAIVLAVSGGPDSIALMWLAARWRSALKRGPRLIAVTVDHGLRAEAAAEARDVKRLARTLDLPHRTLRWSGAKPKTGLPAAAREARYRLLAQAARRNGATHILTAHTRDDQAETLLMRLLRGSGIAGLCGDGAAERARGRAGWRGRSWMYRRRSSLRHLRRPRSPSPTIRPTTTSVSRVRGCAR